MARRPPPGPAADAAHRSRLDHAALYEFSQIVNSSLDLRFVLGHILLTIMGKTLCTRALAMVAHGDGLLRVELVKGLPADAVGATVAIRHPPRGVVRVGRGADPRRPWLSFFRARGLTLLLPLHLGKAPTGLLAFGGRMLGKPLDSRELTSLRSLANLSAAAVEKSRMIEELQQVNRKLDRKIQELNTLFELGKEFGATLETEKLVRLLVFSLLGQVGISRYLICIRDEADMRVVASRIDGPPPQGELLLALARTRAPVAVENLVVRGTLDPRPVLRGLGLRVLVPIQHQGEPRGLLLLGEKLRREPFAPADLEFLSSLGNLAIISLENARLFQEALEKQKLEDELMIAREIQKGLLPGVLPAPPRLDIAATNISSKQVGGDYYDFLTIDERRFVLAIGDVSGKGTPAALLMANLQATIRALVPLRLPLGELTGRVNDLMCQNTGGNKFVTFFWGIVDTAAMTLTYTNAGHNYPMLLHADGMMERLDRGGMILGVMPAAAPYEEASVALRPGDLLLLFTDGVSEAMSRASEEYGEERLEGVLRRSQGASAAEVMDAVRSDIAEHAQGATQSDDITMMVLRVLAADGKKP